VRKIAANGVITTVAGNGSTTYSGDNGPAIDAGMTPNAVVVDKLGDIYISDSDHCRVRMVNPSGVITTVAGNGIAGFSGDGGLATNAEINYAYSLALDTAGNLYIADWGNNRIRKVNTSGIISTVAGNGVAGYSGDNGPATSAEVYQPVGVVPDAVGNLYLTSGGTRVRKVDTTGTITTIAGNGTQGYTGDNGLATNAELNGANSLSIDVAGNLYIADLDNNVVRKVNTAGIITTVAGDGGQGYSGDGGLATSAELNNPYSVAADVLGNIYIADTLNNRLRIVTAASRTLITISVNPTTITLGQSTTLNWSSTNATSCTASGAWSGSEATSGSQSVTPTATGAQTYSLSCTGPGGSPSNSASLTVNSATAPLPDAPLTGVVVSGQQPIPGAHVYLFAANNTGYGLPSISLLSEANTGHADSIGAYVLTGSNGSFSLTGDYTCVIGSQLYLYVVGDIGGFANNSRSGLLAALGNCPSTGVYATVNEVSTVAAAYSFAAFATDATHVSSPGTTLAKTGIKNAFANAANLVTLSTGVALATTPAGNGVAPQSKINNLANMLSVCVESESTCSRLLSEMTSDGTATGAQPTDTATAAINIAHHPAGTLLVYAISFSGPYTPISLTGTWGYTEIFDFTLELSFTGGGLNGPTQVAIDGSGNAWVANYGGSVTELSSAGAAISPSTGFTGGGLNNSTGISIDSSGNAWIANSASVTELSSSGAAISPSTGFTGGGLNSPTQIAIDGSGDAWVTNSSAGSVTELSNAGAAISPSTGFTGGGLSNPYGIAIDSSGNPWVANNTGSVTELSNAGAPISPSTGFTGGGMSTGVQDIAIDAAGDVWTTNYENSNINELSSVGTALSPPTGYSGVDLPVAIAIDGSGSAWVANYGFSNVVQFSSTGKAVLSGQDWGYGFNVLIAPWGIAVDGSGNVWVTDNDQNAVIEIVGCAAPVVTPLATGVKTNTLGTSPAAPVTPVIEVIPSSSSITTAQAVSVKVAVSESTGNPPVTGSVTLTGGGYASAAVPLNSAQATINVPAGSLAIGVDALAVSFTPDSASSSIYNSASGSNSVTVTAPAQIAAPPAANAGGPYTGTAGTAVHFGGTGSTDPQGLPLTYAWNFGDGTTGSGISPIHTYPTAGTYTISLTVTNTFELTSTASSTATIATLEWTWMGGSNSVGSSNGGQPGVYGTLGTPAPGNIPGGRYEAASWTDSSGNLWLFGGYGLDTGGQLGYLNDLWEFIASSKQWAWMGGSNGDSQPGVYGTLGTPAPGNIPGGRYESASWSDSSGNFWLFGGSGYAGNDLWKFNPSTREWTWMAGGGQLGSDPVYGTLGTPAPGNTPGGRSLSSGWTDKAGNVWLFGGHGYYANNQQGDLNDLWEFNPSTSQWAWMGGSNGDSQAGVYGELMTPAAGNIPGVRHQSSSWTDSSGNFWLFGGNGLDANGQQGYLDDLWEFNFSIKQWAWMAGSGTVGSGTIDPGGQRGVYGTLRTPAAENMPGGRESASTWTDRSGNLWLFSGVGYDYAGQLGYLSDLWEFNPPTNEWTWIGGSEIIGCTTNYVNCSYYGVYGTLGTPSAGNNPGGRYPSSSWTDSNGNLWLFGGFGYDGGGLYGYLNDMWEYEPPTPVANAGGMYVATAGTALSFNGSASTDPQGEALTYAWTFGDGATGTGVNPTHTYAVPGTYAVELTVTDTSHLTGIGVATADILPGPTGVAPTITAQPQSVVVNAGQPATFTVSASGTSPLSYQWTLGGEVISGANSATYTIAATTVQQSGGAYAVVVSNTGGSITSADAALTVNTSSTATTVTAVSSTISSSSPIVVLPGIATVDMTGQTGLLGQTVSVAQVVDTSLNSLATYQQALFDTDLSDANTLEITTPVPPTGNVTVTVSADSAIANASASQMPTLYAYSFILDNLGDGEDTVEALPATVDDVANTITVSVPDVYFQPTVSGSYIANLKIGEATVANSTFPSAEASQAQMMARTTGPLAHAKTATPLQLPCPLWNTQTNTGSPCIETSRWNPRRILGTPKPHYGVDFKATLISSTNTAGTAGTGTPIYVPSGGSPLADRKGSCSSNCYLSRPEWSQTKPATLPTPCPATEDANGNPVPATINGRGGITLTIQYPDGYSIHLLHLCSVDPTMLTAGNVNTSASTLSWIPVAYSGNTGQAEITGPHLHYEVIAPSQMICAPGGSNCKYALGRSDTDPFPMIAGQPILKEQNNQVRLISGPYNFTISAEDLNGAPVSSNVGTPHENLGVPALGPVFDNYDPTRKICLSSSTLGALQFTPPPDNPITPSTTIFNGIPFPGTTSPSYCAPWPASGTPIMATGQANVPATAITAMYSEDPTKSVALDPLTEPSLPWMLGSGVATYIAISNLNGYTAQSITVNGTTLGQVSGGPGFCYGAWKLVEPVGTPITGSVTWVGTPTSETGQDMDLTLSGFLNVSPAPNNQYSSGTFSIFPEARVPFNFTATVSGCYGGDCPAITARSCSGATQMISQPASQPKSIIGQLPQGERR
jgi:N-acetylneuraminic acid mutarotase